MTDQDARRPPDSLRDVVAAIKELNSYHEIGRESVTNNPNRVAYGASSELLRKARAFARAYSEADVARLVRLCEEHRTALGRTFVDRLSTITDKRQRRSLEAHVVRERWSRIVLDREIRRRFGRRKTLGRSPHRPRDAEDALSELVRLTLKLMRWGQVMGWDSQTGRMGATDQVTLDDLPPAVAREAKAALRAAQRLQEAAEAALGAG